ncbi:MAG TPA: hypothetical protein DDW84_00745 [Phycisphaerales bacterium]|nr:hypothetical protein [Phycisphaerales bacterium]HBR19558.1 hypothetical protein [Phycisphaerales bacterium]
MIQFMLGRSGTGKTSLCIKQITESLLSDKTTTAGVGAKPNLVYLVPEQATYQAERAILADGRIKGYSRLHILSFQRLCYTIFGKNLAARTLTSQGREMIIHRLLCENADKLSIFASSAEKAGTASRIGAAICELQQYGKSPDDVEKFIQQLNQSQTSELTSAKLADINLIYKQYLEFISGNFFNSDNQLNLAKDSVQHTPFLKGCKLWVDGFAGFTTSEMLLLVELLKVADNAKIALCLDPSELQNPEEMLSIFYPTLKTYHQLKATGFKEEKPIVLTEVWRFEKSKSLAHLEKHIFSFDNSSVAICDDSIKITACAKIRTEVEYVARQVCSLVKQRDFRWRDIAVIASDLEEYRHYIQAIFSDFGIPFFVDRRRNLQQYPAAELITSALKIAAERFATADVMNYLKSDLAPISRSEADLLENYCLAFNVETDDWLRADEWDFAAAGDGDFDNQKIEAIRQKAFVHLLGLRTSLQSPGTMSAEKFREQLFSFLDGLNIRTRLQDWTKAAFDDGRLDEAQLHQQFFSQFTQLLDDFVFIFKNSSFAGKQYASIIASAFSQMTVALIPPALDQVLVGSIERSRHPELKAVFLIGTTAKQFPSPVYYDNILNNTDRNIAGDAGFELARSGSMQLVERRYLAYIAFTRPARQLYITYPLADDKGGEVQSSFFIGQLKSLFSNLAEETYFGIADSFEEISSLSDLNSLLCRRLGRDNPLPADELDAKCKWLLDSVAGGYDFTKIFAALEYDNKAQLDAESAQKLFPAAISSSATKLRTFASCPYQYFAKYILRLKERRIFELKPIDLGKFYHSVFEKLFYKLKNSGVSLANVQMSALERDVDDCIERLLIEDVFLKTFRGKSRHNGYIIESASEIIKDAVAEYAQIARAGCFEQAACETAFGSKFCAKANLPAVEIELSAGRKLCIEGKIDRIDVTVKDGKNYAVIFDYKMSQTTVNYSFLSAGIDLQLPIYMLAAAGRTVDKFGSLIPLGGFYIPIQAFSKSSELEEIDNVSRKIYRKPRGIFNGEFYKFIDASTESKSSPFYSFSFTKNDGQFGRYEFSSLLRQEDFEKLLSIVKNKLKELGERIASGTIDIKPYKCIKQIPCTNCVYKPICRFDRQINDYAEIGKISKEDYFSELD